VTSPVDVPSPVSPALAKGLANPPHRDPARMSVSGAPSTSRAPRVIPAVRGRMVPIAPTIGGSSIFAVQAKPRIGGALEFSAGAGTSPIWRRPDPGLAALRVVRSSWQDRSRAMLVPPLKIRVFDQLRRRHRGRAAGVTLDLAQFGGRNSPRSIAPARIHQRRALLDHERQQSDDERPCSVCGPTFPRGVGGRRGGALVVRMLICHGRGTMTGDF